ncbi:hypothetical protein SVIOM74S_03653 [Streptomyces violarus]
MAAATTTASSRRWRRRSRTAEETGTVLFGSGWDRGGPGLAVTEVHVRSAGVEWTAEDVKTAVAEFVARLPEEVR